MPSTTICGGLLYCSELGRGWRCHKRKGVHLCLIQLRITKSVLQSLKRTIGTIRRKWKCFTELKNQNTELENTVLKDNRETRNVLNAQMEKLFTLTENAMGYQSNRSA